VHPSDAAMTEFDHPIPSMDSIAEVLGHIRDRAAALNPGQWIELRQVFITRLKERRYPTRAELDEAAPLNPVLFATGPDASVNSLALKLSGIDKNFSASGSGQVEKDPQTGEPTGILRNCTRYVKTERSGKRPQDSDRNARLKELLADYNSVGITAIGDRDASPGAIELYQQLRSADELPLRVFLSHHLDTDGPLDAIRENIRKIAAHRLVAGDDRLRIIGVKTYLDGGMLTGSAYLREPWGVSSIYSISDPQYRGLLFIPKERLSAIVEAAVDAGLQFTAHSVGDGAVHTLLDVYADIASRGEEQAVKLKRTRACITHCNFMSREAVETAARLGIAIDVQPIWLYLDGGTLVEQFGEKRLRYFQPLHSLFAAGAVAGGGSDHMQKIGARRAINPYDPFLGMQTTVTRRARGLDHPLHAEEALSREQALRMYTANNAYVLRQEAKLGSLEIGKQADFVILDTDLLTCEPEQIGSAQVLATWVGGREVFHRTGGLKKQ